MQNSVSCYLVTAALVVALPASQALAREQHYRHRHVDAVAAQQTKGMFGFPFASGPPARDVKVAGYTANGGIASQGSAYQGLAAAHASTEGVPQSLIDRVIKRESGGNPRAVSHGNYGLMQIRLGTARAMGYSGSAAGLLDPTTNMTYAVRYLAGAYRAAGGNENLAVALYARGYYRKAKAATAG
jgi:soluble lytic murein transglycosylase-like protein